MNVTIPSTGATMRPSISRRWRWATRAVDASSAAARVAAAASGGADGCGITSAAGRGVGMGAGSRTGMLLVAGDISGVLLLFAAGESPALRGRSRHLYGEGHRILLRIPAVPDHAIHQLRSPHRILR